jgi:hypothetical protein
MTRRGVTNSGLSGWRTLASLRIRLPQGLTVRHSLNWWSGLDGSVATAGSLSKPTRGPCRRHRGRQGIFRAGLEAAVRAEAPSRTGLPGCPIVEARVAGELGERAAGAKAAQQRQAPQEQAVR